MNVIKGFIAQIGEAIYYRMGDDIYRAPQTAMADCRTGYLIGRWECSADHFARYSKTVYGIEYKS